MAYTAYVDIDTYHELGNSVIDEKNLQKQLLQASRHVDSLTYNRIVGKGFTNLTQFQQEIVRSVVIDLAEFEYENAEMLNSILSSYSINGVSMQLSDNNRNIVVDKGIVIKRDLYALLCQSGLCSQILR